MAPIVWEVVDITCDSEVRWQGEASDKADALERARVAEDRTRIPACWYARILEGRQS
jgi:hypothetical protein